MRPFFKRYGWRYIPGFALLILGTWIRTRSPLALGSAIELASTQDWTAFAQQVWLILYIALGVFVTQFSWRYFIIGNSRELEIYLRDRLYDHLAFLPVRFYGENRSGDLMAHAVNDVGMVRMMFGMVVAQIFNAIAMITFSVREMGVLDSTLTLIALAPIPFAIVAVLFIGRKIQRHSRRVQELFATVSGHVQENINGMRVLKAFAQEKAQYQSLEIESDEKRLANMRLYNTGNLLQPVIQLVFGISYMVGLVYGGQLVLNGTIELSGYIAFNTYLTFIVFPVTSIGRISNMLQRGLASYKRLNTLMLVPETSEFDREPDGVPIGGSIEARGLSYTYEDSTTPAVKDLSFSIPEGGVLGIAGPTGGGKSTVMMLLTKLLIPHRGELFIDGRDIIDIPAASIRQAAGYVPQDGFLFNETLRDNIDFFTGASDEVINKAVDAAGLRADVDEMPDGLNTMAGERGNHLSGGQRQRTALARALVRKPHILLLDDTLSAVDAHTEARILSSLKEELAGRTAVIVSHKLSAIVEADHILYMDQGVILEQGTHDELMALGGAYASVYHTQTEEAKP